MANIPRLLSQEEYDKYLKYKNDKVYIEDYIEQIKQLNKEYKELEVKCNKHEENYKYYFKLYHDSLDEGVALQNNLEKRDQEINNLKNINLADNQEKDNEIKRLTGLVTKLSNENQELSNRLDSAINTVGSVEELTNLKMEKSKLKADVIKLNNELEKYNPKLVPNKPKVDKEMVMHVRELLNNGFSYRKIAEKVDLSINTISKIKNGYYDTLLS